MKVDAKYELEKIYIEFSERVFQTAYRILGSEEEAKDIMQDVFLKVFTELKKFRQESSISTWLYRITVNMSINRAHARVRHYTAEKKTATSSVSERPQSTEITLLIDKLSLPLRAVLVLRYNEGLSYQEIADILGISIGTVKSRLHNAHCELKNGVSLNELQ